MRFFKVLATIFIATLFVACNFTEEIYFNEDGTGKMSISFDGGEMMQMLPSTDSTQLFSKIYYGIRKIVFLNYLPNSKPS